MKVKEKGKVVGIGMGKEIKKVKRKGKGSRWGGIKWKGNMG